MSNDKDKSKEQDLQEEIIRKEYITRPDPEDEPPTCRPEDEAPSNQNDQDSEDVNSSGGEE